jgi:hypothetical protein
MKHVASVGTLTALMLCLHVSAARAGEFFVDPAGGSADGDGSREHPWQTWEAVIKAGHVGKEIAAGDTVWLRSGNHGASAIKGGTYSPVITLAAETGQTPQLTSASFAQTRGWVVRGLTLSPSFGTARVATIASVDKASAEVTLRDCKMFSVQDASGWTSDAWINTASSGIQVSGDRVTISHNELTNVRFGISVDGPNALIEYNSVVNFSADGLRGLGDNGVFQYNLVKNVYVSQEDGDDNHDDGFQSWSTGPNGPGSGVVKGVTLRGNIIINREDPTQKLTNSLQGVGCFDGFFDDWIVENNVVVTDHWHGISLYGMRGGRIVNNTVIDVNDVSPGPPWIMVSPHKDGTPSERVVIRNNLATDYSIEGNTLTQDHNTTLKDLPAYFVDPVHFDLHLKPGAPAIDQSSNDDAPELDADRIARPQGGAADLGAYEWHEPSVKPVEAGTGGSSQPPSAAGQGAPQPPSAGRGGGGGGGGRAGATAGSGAAGRSDAGASGGSGGNAGRDAGPGDDAADGGADATADEGCGCRLSTRQSNHGASASLALLGLLAVRVARRRRPRAKHSAPTP